ncbi:MAG: hypothetical protein LAN62_11515, partial [Acidobacteriia bacterium]|nr:hypothetical protein [Terriglobia bacterium]
MSEDCQDLRNFLSGNLEVEYFSDIGIESLREHWYECEECQAQLPDAISRIDARAKAYLSRIVDNLRLLHREFEYTEWQVLHPPVADSLKPPNLRPEDLQPKVVEFTEEDLKNITSAPPARQPHAELLKLLAQAGNATRGQLEFLNEHWGLCPFHVARGDSCEYYSEVCGPLISSLPQEVQLFVFRAMLASEILDLFREEFLAGRMSATDQVSPSPTLDLLTEEFPAEVGSTIYRTVENAAPEFLRKYLQEQEQTIHSKSA